ncbi:MAG: single-stranded-DNA-specific exonuclease RecJ [Bacteroidota bacterium]
MKYRWTLNQKTDEETIRNLVSSLKIPKSLANVLVSRGLQSAEDALNFFEPSLKDLHDPFLMDQMDLAADRILLAVEKGEIIWIHGDYDVDGTSSTAMLLQFLREIGGKVDYYIPDRFDEGYGLSRKSVDLAIGAGVSLVVTVDVGITSFDALEYTREKKIDTIICDHHEPGDTIPDVLAIIDPIKPGCDYPFKFLAACGVVFKLVQAMCSRLEMNEKAYEYLDFVAIASAADMVPLIGENRILVHYGLKQLNRKPRPGINGLIHCTGLKTGSITASNIVYAIAPLINAAGRLGDARRSVEMMSSGDEIAAFRIAQQLEQENRRRRVFDEQTFENAMPLADELLEGKNRRSLVLHGRNWHAGVIGIVASRLVDRYHLPTVLLTSVEGVAKGSARSISDFDIHTALRECADLLIEFGGHKHAAGLSLLVENIPEFRERFDEIARTSISHEMLIPEIMIDSELQLNELSPKFLKILNKFAPYGYENYKPVFISRGVTSRNGVKIVGNNTLKFRAYQNNFVIDAIGYNLADKAPICRSGRPFSILYNLETNSFTGQRSPQLLIKDIKAD